MDMEKRSRWLMRGCLVVLAIIVHLWLALMTLASRTACVFPPCNVSFSVEAWGWLMSLPLFGTPWLQLPTDDWEFAWTGQWVVLTILNSFLAVVLSIGLGKGGNTLFRRVSGRRTPQ